MQKTPTVSDIAEIVGCAPTTVSRYLNKSGYVGVETAKKIKQAIEKLQYKPNFLAQSLRSRVNKTIFMAVPDIENPFFAQLYKVVQSMATANGYFLTVYDTGANLDEEQRVLEFAAVMNVCGIIFFSNNFTQNLLDGLAQLGIPAVVNYYEKCQFDAVHGQKNQSSYTATRHLIDIGHKRIGFVGGSSNSLIEDSRKNGYLNALNDYHIDCNMQDVVEAGFTIAAGKKAGEYFKAQRSQPTAICCANDLVALGLITFFGKNDIRVPQDVSVIGIDNIMYGEVSSPALTSVTSDADQFAQSALNMLLDRITGSYDGPPRDVIVRHEIVVRASTIKLE